MNFLSENGKKIYAELKKHCSEKLRMFDVDHFELEMLANSFDLYAKSAMFCRDYGISMTFGAKDINPEDEDDLDEDEKQSVKASKGGPYQQIRPEYTVMKNEYQNILKHGAKFGLNPGDRDKIFKGLKEDKKKKGFNTGMKAA
jgi:phage terminase small subunit